jgi:hypothetical protein
MVRKQYPVLELANQMPVPIWIWPEPLDAPRVRRALGTRMIGAKKTLESSIYIFCIKVLEITSQTVNKLPNFFRRNPNIHTMLITLVSAWT